MLLAADQRRPRPTRARRGRLLARRAAAVVLLSGLVAGLTVAAWAYWTASATPGSAGAAVAATVNQGATPTATAAAGRRVTVNWGASTLSNGHAVDGYVVKRYDAVSGAPQTTLTGCTGTIAATSCIERGVPSGQWKYTVTPAVSTYWLGAEGAESGVATVAAATISLAKTIFGAPLPQDTTGALAGFDDSEGVTYRLDASTPLSGSPSSVGPAGTATITSLTIPSATEGAHTVHALGDAMPSASEASIGIVTDTIAPTVGAQVTPTPNGAGWSSSAPVQVALSAEDGSGSGIDHIRYTTDGTDPVSSGTAQTYTSALSISSETTVGYYATDVAANASAVQAELVKIDATAPVNALSLSSVSGGAYLAGTTVWYRGTDAGSFTLTNAATDAGGSGAASSATAALAGTSTGWSHSPSVVTTPAGGPYLSASFNWSAGATGAPGASITATDAAGNTTTTALTLTPDSAAPAAGALTVNAVAASGAGTTSVSTAGSFSIVRADYTDAGSGLDSSVLTRETATLSSSDGIAAGTCGSFGSASVVIGSPAQTVSGPSCHRYTLTGTDQVGNVSAISTIVKVDATGPSAPALTLSAATGNTFISGTTVFTNPQAGRSGSFQVAATTADADSGIEKVNFPVLAGFGSGDGDDSSTPFATTYAWSGAVGASGAKTVTATSTVAATATAAFTVTPDTTAPVTGALTVNGSSTTSYSTTGSYAISRTDYTDAGSGVASSVLTRETAALSSSDSIVAGTCGAYGTATVLVGSPAQTVSGPSCQRYTLTGTDQVGNVSTTTSIVKVDATGPSAPALMLSAATGNTFISGTTVFTNPQAGRSGSFQVAATTADADSGIQKVTFPALTGFTGAGASAFDDLSSPFSTTYSWSGAAAGATGAKTVTAVNNAAGTATSSFTVTPDTTSPTVTSVVSRESGGVTTGDGRLEVNDRLIITFSEELLPSTVPSTFSGTETRAASGLLQTVPDVVLTITNFTNGGLDTNDNSYLSSGLLCILGVCSAGTANFGGTATLSAGNTVVTLVVTSLTGDATAAGGPATMTWGTSSALQDRVGNGATGTLSLTNFRLF